MHGLRGRVFRREVMVLLGTVLAVGLSCTVRSGTPPTAVGTSASAPASESTVGRTPSGVADPFAYCALVGTIDAPDARYAGERVPLVIAEAIRRTGGGAPDAPIEVFVRGTSWRCMDGRVHACNVGANLPCGEKADSGRAPSRAVIEFCAANSDAAVVPAAVTGRATVYLWRCTASEPAIVRQVVEADARGFIANIWHEITPP